MKTLRSVSLHAASALLLFSATSSASAQQPQWRPSRVPANNTAGQLTAHTTAKPAATKREHLGGGVVLRWKATQPRSANVAADPNPVTSSNTVTRQPTVYTQATRQRELAEQPAGYSYHQVFDANQPTASHGQRAANPLRNGSPSATPVRTARVAPSVRTASYVQEQGDAFSDPFGDNTPPALPPEGFPNLPPQTTTPAPQQLPPSIAPSTDPLEQAEAAPAPGSVLENPADALPGSPFPTAPQDGQGSASDLQFNPEQLEMPENGLESPSDDGNQLDLPNRLSQDSSILSCNELRDRIRARPISGVSLDVSPSYGEGMRSVNRDTEQERLLFAESSKVRKWHDYTGLLIAEGRLIDLRDDRVVLDVNGDELSFPLRDLSDYDVNYVGESWNVPINCGVGYDQYAGRNFVPSSFQWKAPGHCHKPLYFEQPHLERYGHETGPVLQPLISTAHFFGNIAILPYKMGIHPPNECQYSLGYLRPGNCAPYMVRPFPWSLRGAAVQAGAVVGAAALIP